jgi:hypothetical protein
VVTIHCGSQQMNNLRCLVSLDYFCPILLATLDHSNDVLPLPYQSPW